MIYRFERTRNISIVCNSSASVEKSPYFLKDGSPHPPHPVPAFGLYRLRSPLAPCLGSSGSIDCFNLYVIHYPSYVPQIDPALQRANLAGLVEPNPE
ncbi:hypothetical protein CEXT_391391 [Caerostris extrusa]|uniref:Uncharacterized protein n=1 Tax=Caerostris extrusa TaxID=172846 RepID=A0AAV4VG15_CAEEX|nr:hypothetical protein CEXT_391391 [Caerostris extrusa]